MPDGSMPFSQEPATRRPAATSPARMGPLATLPIFMGLAGRPVVIAGTGPAAAWKIELLAAAGATVRVLDPDASSEVAEAAGRAGPGPVAVHHLHWCEHDLGGAALAIGAIEHEDEARRFAAAARAARVPVNIVDNPGLSDFQLGSIVNRSPLVVAISTDGAAPVLGQAIRARIEAILPRTIAAWLEAAKALRPSIRARGLGFRDRRSFWERFADRALAPGAGQPDAADLALLLDGAAGGRGSAGAPRIGSVALVGAGPGDPDLLTLGAVRALQSADVILYDDLVAPEVLDLARREARRIAVGKRGHGPSCRQDDIQQLVIAEARAGRRVVRLKSGDPLVFGRAGEEMAALAAAGVPCSIVPGVTAAQAAAAALGVSLTHRDEARRVQLVTGHASHGRLPEDLDWAALADHGAMTALYMGRSTLAAFAERVIANGLPPATPAAAVLDASRPGERVVRATIADLAAHLAAEPADAPCLILYGRALRQGSRAGDADATQGHVPHAPAASP